MRVRLLRKWFSVFNQTAENFFVSLLNVLHIPHIYTVYSYKLENNINSVCWQQHHCLDHIAAGCAHLVDFCIRVCLPAATNSGIHTHTSNNNKNNNKVCVQQQQQTSKTARKINFHTYLYSVHVFYAVLVFYHSIVCRVSLEVRMMEQMHHIIITHRTIEQYGTMENESRERGETRLYHVCIWAVWMVVHTICRIWLLLSLYKYKHTYIYIQIVHIIL